MGSALALVRQAIDLTVHGVTWWLGGHWTAYPNRFMLARGRIGLAMVGQGDRAVFSGLARALGIGSVGKPVISAEVDGGSPQSFPKDAAPLRCAQAIRAREPFSAGRRVVAQISASIPTTQARPPRDHARALLDWLQGPGGRTGSILASELEAIHIEVCCELDWEPIGWIAVGRELRRLIGGRKEYARSEGRRLCVYRIPPADIIARPRLAA